MKILHVLNGSHFGGASVMAAELAAAQRALGTDAQVCLLEGGATADRIRQLGVPVLTYELERACASKRDRWGALFIGLREIVLDAKPDILHSHLALPNLLCSRLKRRLPIHWIATLHGSWRQYMFSPETHGAPWRKPILFLRYAFGVAATTRRAEAITTMAQAAASDWAMTGISSTRMRVIANGIRPVDPQARDLRRKWSLPETAFLLGSLGYFAPVKGFDLLITAFDRIASRHPEARLVIAGGNVLENTDMRNGLLAAVNASRATEQIKIIGEQEDSVRFLSSLDTYVSASRSEGMSLSLLEAMHLGLPCVVSSAGGNPEAIRDGQDGLVFQSGNISDLADKLERILADTESAKKMGQSARSRAQSEFTIERCAQNYLNLYKEVLNS